MAACYRQNGDLLVGTSNGLDVLHKGEDKLIVCSTDMKIVTSVIEHHQNLIILYNVNNTDMIEMCLAGDITKRKKLFYLHRTSYTAAIMTVSDRYVVVKNPDAKQLTIYDFTSQQKEKKYSVDALNLQLLPGACLLGVCKEKLQKFKIENGQLVELWTCNDITDGYRLCTDSNGFIYVTTRLLKKIYVVSSQGAANNISIIT